MTDQTTDRYTNNECKIGPVGGHSNRFGYCRTHRAYVLQMATGTIHQFQGEFENDARNAAIAEYAKRA